MFNKTWLAGDWPLCATWAVRVVGHGLLHPTTACAVSLACTCLYFFDPRHPPPPRGRACSRHGARGGTSSNKKLWPLPRTMHEPLIFSSFKPRFSPSLAVRARARAFKHRHKHTHTHAHEHTNTRLIVREYVSTTIVPIVPTVS